MSTSQQQPRRSAHEARHRQSTAGSEHLSTIHKGQGARLTTRKNAAEAAERARHNAQKRYSAHHVRAQGRQSGPERNYKNLVLIVVGAFIALVVLFFVVRYATSILTPGPAEQAAQQEGMSQTAESASTQGSAQDSNSEQVQTDASVSYQGSVYALQKQDDGLLGLICTAPDKTTSTLFKVEGEPIALIRHANTILIPENRDGNWDIVCYAINGQADAAYVADSDGAMVQGSGKATQAQLDGSTLHVTDESGKTTDVSIA